MKTIHLLPVLFIIACSTDSAEPALIPRSEEYIFYNPVTPCVDQQVSVTFDNGYNNNCGVSRIQQRMNDTWITVCEGTPHNGIITFSFTPQTAGSFRFRAAWNRTGKDCPGENIKPFEEDPLIIVEDCCRDFFTVTPICHSDHECAFGVELRLMTTVENWISIVGKLPAGYEFCGLYDVFGSIIEVYSGNVLEIIADYPPCTEGIFIAYFDAPERPVSFGSWTVKDMHQTLYQVEPAPCSF